MQRCNQKVADLFVYRPVVTSRNFRGWIPLATREKWNKREWSVTVPPDNFLDILKTFRWVIGQIQLCREFRNDVSILPSVFSRSKVVSARCKITGYRIPKRGISFQYSRFISMGLMIVTRFPAVFSFPQECISFLWNKYTRVYYCVSLTANKKLRLCGGFSYFP